MVPPSPPRPRRSPDGFDPAALEAAMGELKDAILDLRKQVKERAAQKPEQRAQIREKARTGQLKLSRGPAPASTGPMGPARTGRVGNTAPHAPTGSVPLPPEVASAGGEEWQSLSELAAQNEIAPRPPRRQPPQP